MRRLVRLVPVCTGKVSGWPAARKASQYHIITHFVVNATCKIRDLGVVVTSNVEWMHLYAVVNQNTRTERSRWKSDLSHIKPEVFTTLRRAKLEAASNNGQSFVPFFKGLSITPNGCTAQHTRIVEMRVEIHPINDFTTQLFSLWTKVVTEEN